MELKKKKKHKNFQVKRTGKLQVKNNGIIYSIEKHFLNINKTMEFLKISQIFDLREYVKLRKAVCKKPVEMVQICKCSANTVEPTEDMKGLTINRCRSYRCSMYLTLFYDGKNYYKAKSHLELWRSPVRRPGASTVNTVCFSCMKTFHIRKKRYVLFRDDCNYN